MCKKLSNDDVGVSRDTVFRIILPGAGLKTDDFVQEGLGGLPAVERVEGHIYVTASTTGTHGRMKLVLSCESYVVGEICILFILLVD